MRSADRCKRIGYVQYHNEACMITIAVICYLSGCFCYGLLTRLVRRPRVLGCSGDLRMAPSPLNQQPSGYKSPHDWLVRLGKDLAACVICGAENGTN